VVEISSAQLQAWVSAFLWPLARILGLIAAAPLLGHRAIPARLKLGLGVLLAMPGRARPATITDCP